MDLVVADEFEAIGTQWTIEFDASWAGDEASLTASIHRLIDRFDRRYSRFKADSLVSRMARQAGDYHMPSDARAMLDLYYQLYEITNGAVTPLIGRSLEQAGYDATYSLRPGKVDTAPAWKTVLEYSYPRLTVKRPVVLDFGAIGKGHLVDLVASRLRRAGMRKFVINAGGDIFAAGMAVGIALEDPADASAAIGIARLQDMALCGSAGNRRAWAGFHHIIDPHTGRSPRHLQAVWVAAASTGLADGLSTALFFSQPEALRRIWPFEYAMILADGELQCSAGFPAEFFV